MKTNYLKSRHIGLSEREQQHMLKTIGVNTIDELIAQTMPSDILLDEPLDLDEALTEQEHLATMHQMAAKNQLYRSYIGRGWYGSITPAVIQRNILENPVCTHHTLLTKRKSAKVVSRHCLYTKP